MFLDQFYQRNICNYRKLVLQIFVRLLKKTFLTYFGKTARYFFSAI